MPSQTFTDDELLAFLDELLPVERAVELEQCLRSSEGLRHRLAVLIRGRDQGGHSVGEIWRQERLSCPDRETLGSWLLGVVDDALSGYIQFHLQTIGCRFCNAELDELSAAPMTVESSPAAPRRPRYFESSAGLLSKAGSDQRRSASENEDRTTGSGL
jgi:hypothetical protein